MKNLVVAKFQNGRLVKGFTQDFSPKRSDFHIFPGNSVEAAEKIILTHLKAVFFVKTTTGNLKKGKPSSHSDSKRYGKLLEIEFFDGETIRGYAQIYNPRDVGFFMFPDDQESNNERIYIIRKAARAIRSI